MMSKYDNKMLNELYDELDRVYQEQSDMKKYRTIKDPYERERVLQDMEEEIMYIKMKIEEIAIIQSDYSDDESDYINNIYR